MRRARLPGWRREGEHSLAALSGDCLVRRFGIEATIRLDANGAWDEQTALEALHAFYPQRVALIEQPVAAEDIDGLARVRAESPTRIAADESADSVGLVDRVIAARAADPVVLKPMTVGGLTTALTLARRAGDAGIGALVMATFDSSVGTAASLHLAAALPADAAHGLATGEHVSGDVVSRKLLPWAGRMAIPSAPGLGVEIDGRALDAVAAAPSLTPCDWSQSWLPSR